MPWCKIADSWRCFRMFQVLMIGWQMLWGLASRLPTIKLNQCQSGLFLEQPHLHANVPSQLEETLQCFVYFHNRTFCQNHLHFVGKNSSIPIRFTFLFPKNKHHHWYVSLLNICARTWESTCEWDMQPHTLIFSVIHTMHWIWRIWENEIMRSIL